MKKKHILIVFALVVIAGLILVFSAYGTLRDPNVTTERIILVPSGSDFDDVARILEEEKVLDDWTGFRKIAELKGYIDNVKPGRYLLKEGWSNEEVINALRSGDQAAVRLTFNSINNFEHLAGTLASYVEVDSASILQELRNEQVIRSAGFTKETFYSAFVPNTYEVWWTVTAEELVKKLIDERKAFWAGSRRKKAKKLELNTQEVATLASIVRAETASMEDAPSIAGVYLNRLRIGIPLQADPTLLFAIGDDSIKRVLDKDKEIDSPYNTYKYAGLPPGPINIPDPQYIDAVLDHDNHKYLYFCASADLSGRTTFAKSYGEHIRNAKAYHRALNEQGIYR